MSLAEDDRGVCVLPLPATLVERSRMSSSPLAVSGMSVVPVFFLPTSALCCGKTRGTNMSTYGNMSESLPLPFARMCTIQTPAVATP